ncbi:TonB-dependent siderophore receptor [Phormidesmis sp. 146-33]
MRMRWAAGQGLQRLSWTVSVLSVVVAASAGATEPAKVLQARDLPASAKTVQQWTAQVEAATAQITQIRLVPIEGRLQVQIETADGRTLQATTREEGNTLIAEIANAVLALPDGGAFRAEKPAISALRNSVGTDITEVTATQVNAATVQIRIVGSAIVPVAGIVKSDRGLILSVEPDEDAVEEEITVTGEGARGYRVPNASTATRTDTPLRDIPASIQVVPRQVLEDRNVRTINEAVETVSGVVSDFTFFGAPGLESRIIRGFSQGANDGGGGNLRNGFRDGGFYGLRASETFEQVEVLKGPASVLFGSLEPGGVINVVTKQPLSDPYYKIALEIGNRNFYQPTIDFSGPLTSDKSVLYRLIASYQTSDGVQKFVNTNLTAIAPTLTWKLGDRTTLNLYYEYLRSVGDSPTLPSGLFDGSAIFPREFFPGYPQFSFLEFTTQRYGYTLNHEFSDNLQIRNTIAVNNTSAVDLRAGGSQLLDNQFLVVSPEEGFFSYHNVFGQIDLLGKFNTGSIAHQLLVGFDYYRVNIPASGAFGASNIPTLDILNPNYNNIPEPIYDTNFEIVDKVRSYGFYIQDQVTLLDNLKLLIGGRFDWVSTVSEGDFRNSGQERNNSAFSPRIGLVYQPSKTISLYASYSQSFQPVATFGAFNTDGEAFEPTKGTQYETGIKADFLDGRLSATLAAYQITKTNVITPDPVSPRLSIQTGEQRSRGVELDVTGRILPGWNVIASYAYTDAKVTEDNSIPVGNRLQGVPEQQASLWTTYQIQKGGLSGFGVGLGLFYVGNRQGNLANSFTLGNYFRTDASLFYRRDRFNAAVNIRNLFDIDYFNVGFERGDPLTITGSISLEF